MSEEKIPDTILAINGISVCYNSVEVVHGVTIEVKERTIIAFIGPNGAGKSSVLRAVSGLVRPSGGEILFCGRSLVGLPPHEIAGAGIGHVMEDRHLFGSLTVEDNLMLAIQGKRTASGNSIETVFQRWPILATHRHQVAGSLSGGEQQILAIARTLMLRPRLLLLDEPSWGLAPRLVRDLMQTIRQLCSEGMTILLVEQMAKIALNVCHYGYLMSNGKIVMEGEAHDLLANPDLQASYLGGKVGREKEVHDVQPVIPPRPLSSDASFRRTGPGIFKENERLRVSRQHSFDSLRIKADAKARTEDTQNEIFGSKLAQTISAGESFDLPSSKTMDWYAFERKRRDKEARWAREHSELSVSATPAPDVLKERKNREPTRNDETAWKQAPEISDNIDNLKPDRKQKRLRADWKDFETKRRARQKAWVPSMQSIPARELMSKEQDDRKAFEMARKQRQAARGLKNEGAVIKSQPGIRCNLNREV
jgi:branched-chain amino acid transport system ATP-binding protein